MNIADLFNAATSSSNSFEVLKSDGTQSGHRITLKAHTDKDVILAAARYNRVRSLLLKRFDDENSELLSECKEAEDFTEYKFKREFAQQELLQAFAVEVVEGWDFDNQFSKHELMNVMTLVSGDHSLAEQVLRAYNNMIEEQKKK